MPQLDFATYTSQLFWLFVSFSVLYVALSRLTLPRLEHLFELRSRKIEGTIEAAQDIKKEAESLAAAFEETLEEHRARAQGITLISMRSTNEMIHDKQKAVVAGVLARIKQGEQKILQEQDKATAHVAAVAEEVAQDIVTKVLRADVRQKGPAIKGDGVPGAMAIPVARIDDASPLPPSTKEPSS